MIRTWLLCAIALVMDAALVGRMAGLALSVVQLSALLAAHVAVCLLFSGALVSSLPESLRRPAGKAGLFVFLSVVFIPVLGMLGLAAFIAPALRRQRLAARPSGWAHAGTPGLPSKPAQLQGSGALSRCCDLAGRLQHAADPAQRIAALISTLCLADPQAVPLLRLALKDPDDEVRLLAYALLNRKEKAVEARMREQQAALAQDVPEQVFLQHKALAHDYWELAHLGDPRGDALIALCARAHEHVRAALKLRPRDGGMHFLSGRVLLVQAQLDAASEAFEVARQCGIDARQITAMLAEVAFRRQRYADVRRHLSQAGSGARQRQLNKLSTYWSREHA